MICCPQSPLAPIRNTMRCVRAHVLTQQPSYKRRRPTPASVLTLILVSITVSGCATNAMIENRAEGKQEISTDENLSTKRARKKNRFRLLKRIAKETGHINKDAQARRDELQYRHPEIKNKPGHPPPRPTPKKKGFWERFKKFCRHPACIMLKPIEWVSRSISASPP